MDYEFSHYGVVQLDTVVYKRWAQLERFLVDLEAKKDRQTLLKTIPFQTELEMLDVLKDLKTRLEKVIDLMTKDQKRVSDKVAREISVALDVFQEFSDCLERTQTLLTFKTFNVVIQKSKTFQSYFVDSTTSYYMESLLSYELQHSFWLCCFYQRSELINFPASMLTRMVVSIQNPNEWETVTEEEFSEGETRPALLCHPLLPHPSDFLYSTPPPTTTSPWALAFHVYFQSTSGHIKHYRTKVSIK
jgi:hypothetical protein